LAYSKKATGTKAKKGMNVWVLRRKRVPHRLERVVTYQKNEQNRGKAKREEEYRGQWKETTCDRNRERTRGVS